MSPRRIAKVGFRYNRCEKLHPMSYTPPGSSPDPDRPQQDPTASPPSSSPPSSAPPSSGPPSSGPPSSGPPNPYAPQPGVYGQPPSSGQPGVYGQPPQQDPYSQYDLPGSTPQQPYQPPQPPQAQPYGQPAYDQQYASSAPPTYGGPPPQGYGGQPYAASRGTNVMAILSLVLSILGLFTCITAPIGAILGHVAKRQIATSGEEGKPLATAGIIIGWVLTALFAIGIIIAVIAIVATANNSTTTY
jgi:hypothetical protein